jgi:hypothetical protein
LVFAGTKATPEVFCGGTFGGLAFIVLVVEYERTTAPGTGNDPLVFAEHYGGCFVGEGN